MQVLITRPREDAERLLAETKARGVEALVEPLMTIVPRRGVVLDLVGVQAILLTSANGARALAATTERRDLRVLAVGEATAATARDAGFAQVESAEGNAEDLARMAMVRLEPKDGSLLHVAGRDVSGDLVGRLAQAGFAVRRVPLYEAEAATSLSPEAHAALGSGAIDAVLLFSPRTAHTLIGLMRGEGLVERMGNVTAICLSQAVALAAAPIPWRNVVTALEPTQAELLAAFDRWRRGDTDPAKPPPAEIAAAEIAAAEIAAPEIAGEGFKMADMRPRDGAADEASSGRSEDSKATPRPSHPTIDVEPIPETLRAGVTGRDGRGWRVAVTVVLLVLFLGIVVVALRPWWPRQIEAWLTASPARAPSATTASPPVPGATVAQPSAPSAAPSADLAALRAELAKAQERTGEAERRAAALEVRLGAIDGELAALKSAAARPAASASGEARSDGVAALTARLATLESELKSLEQAARGQKQENDGDLVRRIDALAAAINARPAADPAELATLRAASAQSNTGQAQLAQRLAAIEARQSNAQAHAERGASLALAVARLAQAARGSQPFDAELEALATLVGSDAALAGAIAPLRPLADTGVATIEQLRRRFPQVVSAVKQAELRGSHGGFIGEALARLSRLVTVRRIEESEGAGTDAALARAETALTEGNLAAAVAAIAALPPEQKAPAQSWLDAAEARLTVERVMAQLAAVAGAPRS